MDSDRLSLFLRSVDAWPRNASELEAVAFKLRQLLEVPWVVVGTPELGGRSAFPESAGGPSPEKLVDYVWAQIERLRPARNGEDVAVRRIRIGPETAPLTGPADGVDHVALVPAAAIATADPGQTERWSRTEFGWLAAGYSRSLPARTELLLLAAAQHLAYLAGLARAEAAITLREGFLSIVSHELKTPLTSIYGVLQLQERMLRPRNGAPPLTPEQEKQRTFFTILIRQVERLNELIDGLLNVSRIQAGRFTINPEDTDIAAVLRETVNARLQILAAEAEVSLEVEAPPALAVWVDPVRFEEVVTNLGMNAIRFSPEGGIVRLKLGLEGEQAVLAVRDQGPGVPEIDRGRIFQPFERAQRTGRMGGLGLGLFISRQIAQLHGGNVCLLPNGPAQGNVFEARFPVRPGAAASGSACA